MIQLGMLISNRYEIQEKVGSGGMSVVYKARDIKLSRTVAVKILRDEYCYDEVFVGKFKVEAQAAASLSHMNIVNIYDVGNDGKIYYIVMEFLDGLTLKDHIKVKGHLEDSETMRIGACIASALECAHTNHIFHRDIKPQNIIITKDGRVKVADFGIARIATGATIPAADMASGSVHYIAPEQAKGGYSNEKSDIYSLGITMFEMITGDVPFKAESAVSVALKQIHDDLPDISEFNPKVDHNLMEIVKKATQKKAEMRYASAEALLSDLKHANNFPQEDFVKIDRIDDDAPTMIMSNTQMRQIWSENEVLEDEKGKSERIVVISAVISAVIIAAVIANFVFAQFKEEIIPTEYTIPDIVGMDVNEVVNTLSPLTMTYEITESFYDDVIPKDQIMEQVPLSGTVVGENTLINVRVSKGQELFKVPDMTSRKDVTYTVAKEMIVNAKLNVVQKTEFSDTYPVGIVYEQIPEAGAEVPKGTDVTIVVSKGKETKYVVVPDVTRKPLNEAIGLLKAAGLTVNETVTEAHNDVVAEGSVIALTVTPGEAVREGYEVDLTISLGAEIKPVTQVIQINDILNIDQDSALLKVLLIQDDVEKVIYDSIVTHDSFDKPIEISVTGLGTAIYEVYKDGNLEYPKQIKFTEENVAE